jgi:predicted esterase
MFYGNEDPLVPESNGTTLKTKFDQFGIENTLRIYNGGHGDNWSFEDLTEAQMIISDYIDNYL